MINPPAAAIASTPAPTPEPIYVALFESSDDALLSVPADPVATKDGELLLLELLLVLVKVSDWVLDTGVYPDPELVGLGVGVGDDDESRLIVLDDNILPCDFFVDREEMLDELPKDSFVVNETLLIGSETFELDLELSVVEAVVFLDVDELRVRVGFGLNVESHSSISVVVSTKELLSV